MAFSRQLGAVLLSAGLLSSPAVIHGQSCAVDAPEVSVTGSFFTAAMTQNERHFYEGGIPHPLGTSSPLLVQHNGSTVWLRHSDSLNDYDSVALGASSKVDILEEFQDGDTAVLASRVDGVVSRVDYDPDSAGSMATNWSRDFKRAGCTDLIGDMLIQLRGFSSAGFKANHSTDLVYVGTHYIGGSGCAGDTTDNRVYALNPEDKSLVWTFNATGGVDLNVIQGMAIDNELSSPISYQGFKSRQQDQFQDRLFVTTEQTSSAQDSVWAIDVLTGALDWSVDAARIWAKPVVRDDRLYVANLNGDLKALDKTNGSELWSINNGSLPFPTDFTVGRRAPYDNLIALTDFYGQITLARDNGASAEWLWTTSLFNITGSAWASTTPVIDDINGYVYVGTNDGKLYQLDIATGAVGPTRTVDGTPEEVTHLLRQSPEVNSGGTGVSFSQPLAFSLVTATENTVISRYCTPFMYPPGTLTADGDINVDGSVNAADILLGAQVALGGRLLNPEQFGHGDVAPLISNVPTPDGDFGLADVMVITRKALGLISF